MFNAFSFSAPAAASTADQVVRGFDEVTPGDVTEANLPTSLEAVLHGDFLFLPKKSSNSVPVYDVSDFSSPVRVSTLYCEEPEDVGIEGNLCAVVGGKALRIYDISDPANPQSLYHVTNEFRYDRLVTAAIRDDVLFTSSQFGGGFYAHDLTDPSNPVILGSNSDADRHFLLHGEVAYLWEHTSNDLNVVDLSDLTAMPTIKKLSAGAVSSVSHMVASGGRLIGSGSSNEGHTYVWDIADPRDPQLINRIDLEDLIGAHRQADSFYDAPFLVVFTHNPYRLLVLDLRDPTTPEIAFEVPFSDFGKDGVFLHDFVKRPDGKIIGLLGDGSFITLGIPRVDAPSVRAGALSAEHARAEQSTVGRLVTSEGANLLGTQERGLRAVAADASIEASDHHVVVTDTSAARTLTLPRPLGRRLVHVVKDGSGGAGTNAITIQGAGGALIDGQASAQISADYGSLALISDGTNWFITARG